MSFFSGILVGVAWVMASVVYMSIIERKDKFDVIFSIMIGALGPVIWLIAIYRATVDSIHETRKRIAK